MNDEMKRWETIDGVKFLKRIGIKSGQTVLDFGARFGHYSLPTAKIVGKDGRVYALDKNSDALDELKLKLANQGLDNIILVKSDGNLKIELENKSVDVVLLYDVLHLIDNRKKLYFEVHRVLQNSGFLSVYPKHNKFDMPRWGLKNMTPKDIKNEIEAFGFSFEEEYCSSLSHDGSINQGCVLNFKKKGGII